LFHRKSILISLSLLFKLQSIKRNYFREERIEPQDEQEAPQSTTAQESSPGSMSSLQDTPNKNYKNLLQEFCQKNNHNVPVYNTVDVGDQHSHASVLIFTRPALLYVCLILKWFKIQFKATTILVLHFLVIINFLSWWHLSFQFRGDSDCNVKLRYGNWRDFGEAKV
jgi:hypothetical protein